MIDIEKLKDEIVQQLKPLNPYKVILFGSYAYGKPNENSDIDLYIVTQDEFIPQSFKENITLKMRVSKAIDDICKRYPTDILTHTKAMHEKFVELDSMFSRKILKDGISLL